MAKEKITIGNMIEDEVRRKGIPITTFAGLISTNRQNVYNIFNRNSIDIELLGRISKVLNHNFFKDLADDYALADPVEIDVEEYEKSRIIKQFLEVVPTVFSDLGIDAAIVLGAKLPEEKNIPLPDFILTKFNITFTVGQSYEEKCNGYWGNDVKFHPVSPEPKNKIVGYINQGDGTQYCDIAIDYKSKEEWRNAIVTALDFIKGFYLPHTWATMD